MGKFGFSLDTTTDDKTKAANYGKPKIPRRWFLKKSTQSLGRIVILDDKGLGWYEHQLWRKGGGTDSMDAKVPCAAPMSGDLDTKNCEICRRMLKDDGISRKLVHFITIVDLIGYTSGGKEVEQSKRLMALDQASARKLKIKVDKMVEAGRKAGLVGAVFEMRWSKDDVQSQVPDSWELDTGYGKKKNGLVNPYEFFANSPLLKDHLEYVRKRAPKTTPEEALKDLLAPYNYEEVWFGEDGSKAARMREFFMAVADGDKHASEILKDDASKFEDDAFTSPFDSDIDFNDDAPVKGAEKAGAKTAPKKSSAKPAPKEEEEEEEAAPEPVPPSEGDHTADDGESAGDAPDGDPFGFDGDAPVADDETSGDAGEEAAPVEEKKAPAKEAAPATKPKAEPATKSATKPAAAPKTEAAKPAKGTGKNIIAKTGERGASAKPAPADATPPAAAAGTEDDDAALTFGDDE